MPPQACANGLLLPPIPPELRNLSDLERRVIALRIPFMSIFCMVRYGSQYKIRGGCTNVPASLDQIVTMLPRMSSEVQFHPMKLKRRMIYKSNYMYNFIHKDVVIAAIKWLKENNKLYEEVEFNSEWADEWLNSEFSSFLNNDENQVENDNQNDSDVELENSTSDHENNEEENTHIMTNDTREHRELMEDCTATDNSHLLTGRPTANVLQLENLENEIYTCAPGENNTPRYMLLDDKFEVLAFPDMFPYGTGGYSTSGIRKTKLTLRRYFQQCLFNVDGRFANNIEYLFAAQYATEIKQIQADSNIALRLKRGKTIDGTSVTAGML